MFAITIRKWTGHDWVRHEMNVPTLPRAGDYIANDQLKIVGNVRDVDFYWNEVGALEIFVTIK